MINKVVRLRQQGQALFPKLARASGNSMDVENAAENTVMPDSIDDSESVFLRCSRLHSFDPDAEIRGIPYNMLILEFKRYHALLTEYTLDEIDSCYQIPTELCIKFKFREEKELKERTIRNYILTAKYNFFHIFRFGKLIECSEHSCPCRILIPSEGFYNDESDVDRTKNISKRPHLNDIKDISPKLILLPLEPEEIQVFELSHDSQKHLKISKCPLNTEGVLFSNGQVYDVLIRNKTAKYKEYLEYCDHCCQDVHRKI